MDCGKNPSDCIDSRSSDGPHKRKRDSPDQQRIGDPGHTGVTSSEVARDEAYPSSGSPVKDAEEEIIKQAVPDERVSVLPIVRQGLKQMAARKQAVDNQLEDLTTEGLRMMEAAKNAFIEKMERIKIEFDNYHQGQKNSWMECSEESQAAEEKLEQVAKLVNQLNAAAAFNMTP